MVVAQERYDHYSLPEEDSRMNRHLRRSRLPREGKLALLGLVLLTFCTGLMIAYYYTQVLITAHKTSSLGNELAALRQETISLSEEVDRLNSLDRIEYVATNKLKMVKPGSKDVVVVRADMAGEGGRINPSGAVQKPPGSPEAEKPVQAQQNFSRSKVVQAFASLLGIKGS
ncbi:MAG: cell division protein FtsL [Bacillota bacterium]